MSSRESIWKRSFPRKRFSWKEPRDFVRAEAAEEAARLKWWAKPGACLLISVLLMAQWALARLNPSHDPLALPVALALAIGGGIVLIYVLPPLIALVPSWVDIYETRIALARHGLARHVHLKDVESVDLTSKHGFIALSVTRKDSKWRKILIGVAPEVDTKNLTEFFDARRAESLP